MAKPKPLWKMTDAELSAIADSDDECADEAWAELEARAEDRRNPPEDTPSLSVVDVPMSGPLKMSKDEMAAGLALGRTLTQEEWAHPLERRWVEELIAEGKATATPWRYHDNFQCQMRRVTGIKFT